MEATTYRALSDSSRKLYLVQLNADGTATCECPSWLFCKGPRAQATCKHTRRARAGQPMQPTRAWPACGEPECGEPEPADIHWTVPIQLGGHDYVTPIR